MPDKPGAWLMAVAKRRAIDHFRRSKRLDEKQELLVRDLEDMQEESDPAAALPPDEDVGDDLLRLMFIACHPVLSTDSRVALTLRLLGGLSTEEIARAFLTPGPTIAQRIVRAKRTLAEANVPFELPPPAELSQRLGSVLEVIYLIFNEGYSATAGDDWMRPSLCAEALRLGRVLAELAPEEPEVHGLVGLMEIQASRTRARTGPQGEPILLLDQNRARWDRLLIRRGLSGAIEGGAPGRSERLLRPSGSDRACHARASTADETDWERIVSLYDALMRVYPSPVVELNRAVAVSMARGPEAGLAIVDGIVATGALAQYHLLPSVRGDFLLKLGRHEEAAFEFEHACVDDAERPRARDDGSSALRRRGGTSPPNPLPAGGGGTGLNTCFVSAGCNLPLIFR